MTIFDLIFILLFLGTLIALLLSLILRKRRASSRILVSLGVVWCVYLAILAVTDVLASPKVFNVGEDECFDEMCFAVTDMQALPGQASGAEARAWQTGSTRSRSG